MPRRLKIAAALLFLLIAALATWSISRPHEPVYQGRRLSDWLDDYNRADSLEKIEPASAAVRAMGTNCLPFLLAHIKHNPSPLVSKLVTIVRKQPWLKLPFYGFDRFHSPSLAALNALGPQAAPLCPELLALTKDPRTSWSAITSLLAIGTNSIPFLETACQNTNRLGTDAVLMLALMKAMPPPYFSWGWYAAPVNRNPVVIIGIDAGPGTVREIANLLEHPSPAVRRASADALRGYTGPTYTEVLESAVPLLTKACADTNNDVRTSAARTLKSIDPEAAAKAGIK